MVGIDVRVGFVLMNEDICIQKGKERFLII
jgi:hypothetical protein